MNNGTDTNIIERIFNPKNNEDYVSTFEKGGDEDDITSTTKINLIIAYNTVFDKLSVNCVILILTRFLLLLYFQILKFKMI